VRIVRVYEASDVGCVRPINEDAVASFAPNTFLVADGMGGHAAGEVASRSLVETVRHVLQETPVPWNAQVLSLAVRQANDVILRTAKDFPAYRGMGTTATLLHIHEDTAYYAHVGDSRLYLMRGGSLLQITRDHSYVEELLESGSITAEEARSHPRRNVLTRAVGVVPDVQVDGGSFLLEAGDCLLLCTDGLTNMVTDEEILEILQMDGDLSERLVQRALQAGGTDNVSVLVVAWDAE